MVAGSLSVKFSCYNPSLLRFHESLRTMEKATCIIDRLHACVLSHFNWVQLFATPWTVACQVPLAMGFSRQEYWSGFLCLPPGDLPIHFSSVQFETPWTTARQASLSITNSQSLLKLMSIESVMPSNHLVPCCPLSSHLQSFPASGSFKRSQFFTSGSQSIGVSASASVLPMNI